MNLLLSYRKKETKRNCFTQNKNTTADLKTLLDWNRSPVFKGCCQTCRWDGKKEDEVTSLKLLME